MRDRKGYTDRKTRHRLLADPLLTKSHAHKEKIEVTVPCSSCEGFGHYEDGTECLVCEGLGEEYETQYR